MTALRYWTDCATGLRHWFVAVRAGRPEPPGFWPCAKAALAGAPLLAGPAATQTASGGGSPAWNSPAGGAPLVVPGTVWPASGLWGGEIGVVFPTWSTLPPEAGPLAASGIIPPLEALTPGPLLPNGTEERQPTPAPPSATPTPGAGPFAPPGTPEQRIPEPASLYLLAVLAGVALWERWTMVTGPRPRT